MCNDSLDDPDGGRPSTLDVDSAEKWQTFAEIVLGLHKAGIFLHPHQLATFMLAHGLPVDLCYVPPHLQQKARLINENYRGDMARLEDMKDPYWHPLVIIEGQEVF
jgi:hypothetical protein